MHKTARRSVHRALGPLALLPLILTMAAPVGADSAPSGRIVFSSLPPGTYGFGTIATTDLFSIRPDGSGILNLTNTPLADEEQPAISRDGSKILYRVSDRNLRVSGFELYSADADGGRVTRITNDSWAEESPTWTPDGGQIVFSSNRNDPNPECLLPPCQLDLYVSRSDGSHVRQLTNLRGGAAFFPSVSPDGRTVLFTFITDAGDTALYAIGIDGSGLVRLTSFAQEFYHGHWSPDGTRIAFSDQGCISCTGGSIWTMLGDGTGLRRLTFGTKQSNDYNAQWSPDGQWLTFTRQATKSFSSSDIYVVRADGTSETLVIERGVNFESTWGPG